MNNEKLEFLHLEANQLPCKRFVYNVVLLAYLCVPKNISDSAAAHLINSSALTDKHSSSTTPTYYKMYSIFLLVLLNILFTKYLLLPSKSIEIGRYYMKSKLRVCIECLQCRRVNIQFKHCPKKTTGFSEKI